MVNSTDLAKTLNYQSGLRVENNCQNCGFPQVRINGLEGPYSQILINSRPIISALSRGVWTGTDSGKYDRAGRSCTCGGGSALFERMQWEVLSILSPKTLSVIPSKFPVCFRAWTDSRGSNIWAVMSPLVAKDNSYGIALYERKLSQP